MVWASRLNLVHLTPQAAENTNFLAQPASGFPMTWFVIFIGTHFYATLSNLLVLLWSAALVFVPTHEIGAFAQNANVAAAITFYIVTVGIANYLIFGWLKLSFFERTNRDSHL